MKDDFKTIYLTPHCAQCEADGEEILWCQDPQEPCDRCGKEWIAYDLRAAAAGEKTHNSEPDPGPEAFGKTE